MDHAAFVDLSRDVPTPSRAHRRQLDSVEDRSNAHVMRSNRKTTDQIVRRFGYEPHPLAPSEAQEPSRSAFTSGASGARSPEMPFRARDKRGLMEPG